jgi:hypothetical protein
VGGDVTDGVDNVQIEFADPAEPTVSQWGAATIALLPLTGGTLVAARTSAASA